MDSSSAEPVYTGYLSIKVQGKSGETLWSYLANPKRVSFGDLKHDLVTQLVGKLVDDIATGVDAAVATAGPSGTAVTLRGAGATFPYPIYQDWFQSFHARHPAWQFQYEPVGSEAGLAQLAAGKVDFAGSDIPADASLEQFASVRGAVVLIYNLPRFGDDLRLTREVLAGIFSGKIKTWNDPALRALNRRSSLPNAPITIVHRAEGSGTTFALTGFLTKPSAAWNWQAGIPAAGNEGVAKLVADTTGPREYRGGGRLSDWHIHLAGGPRAFGSGQTRSHDEFPGVDAHFRPEAMLCPGLCTAAKRLCGSRTAAGQARKLKSMSCRCVPSASSAFGSRVYTPSDPNSQL